MVESTAKVMQCNYLWKEEETNPVSPQMYFKLHSLPLVELSISYTGEISRLVRRYLHLDVEYVEQVQVN